MVPSEIIQPLDDILITNEEDIQLASRALKAIAHPLRLKILCILGAATEVSVQDIVVQVGTSQSNISQHLSILRDKGILASRKHANKVFYRIADPRILQLIGAMRMAFCTLPDER
ncbi:MULTISPECIES: ArsR/SmtB family transcription factor [Acidiferrobacter]|jgi:ArsR family transcriptional regulator|uniref:Transcriptional regulator n=1 Tax=Acidiferrobacter thiooxydans TaxID=163359 RepID=A0A1C2G3V5_9GAMM|nr:MULTISPECIES: metalloregulator ArsR/SmtB family transcription factor [Acidiferrobacter]MDA8119970.1 metalloregulator ArsR/SmtB family transcription factor [Gammaproteobacteria bacterium]AWP22076.1 transcriptional regulator [Acidiferrobacter sp. SPIII_3]MDA8191682.1 metalloregulator ArsR/SmtB family transcription factor [Gammaproteobacteria bacterium]RCN58361.1 transcriptional regulator [Acidiferrobacter thiooxydans]UEN99958.1 metalloregulator ArsR/SmtB family transcription factor [Acidiferr